MRYTIFKWGWQFIDMLYPPECGGCGKSGVRWCSDCDLKTDVVRGPICPLCGQIQPESQICSRCRHHPPSFEAVRSWAEFTGPLRRAMHRLKYRRDIGLGEILARHLLEIVHQEGWQPDLISPVPLGTKRIKERGYNQAGLLARPLAFELRIAYNPQAICRARETRTQVGLTVHERLKNVGGAFVADANIVRNQCILVVDDVSTSGATLQACSDALIDAGARQVYGLTLARALQPASKEESQ